MALKQCRECGGKVSTGAATCPHCGVGSPGGGVASFSPRIDTSLEGNARSCIGCLMVLVILGAVVIIGFMVIAGLANA